MAKPPDPAILQAALDKLKIGHKLTQAERRAVDRFQRDRRETVLVEAIQAVPQRLFRQWIGGRQTKQLGDLERRYGIPCTGAKIDVPAVLLAFCDLVTENAHRLTPKDATGPGFTEGESPALERKRAAEADMAEMKRDQMAGQLKPVEEIRQIINTAAHELRRGIRRLKRKYGPDAERIMTHAIERTLQLFDSGVAGDA